MNVNPKVLAVLEKLKGGIPKMLAKALGLKTAGPKSTPALPASPAIPASPAPPTPDTPSRTPASVQAPGTQPVLTTSTGHLAPVSTPPPKPAPSPTPAPPPPPAPVPTPALTLRDLAGVNDPVTAAAAKQLGIGAVRLRSALWSTVQPSSSSAWNWGPADAEVTAAIAAGLDPVMLLGYTPGWAQANPKAGLVSLPNSTDAFLAYVDAACTRYAGKVKYYQIWNEPEPGAFLAGTLQQYFDLLLIPAAPVVRRLRPGQTSGGQVVLGGWPCNQWLANGPAAPAAIPPMPTAGLYGILLAQPAVRAAIDVLDLHYVSAWAFEAVYRDWVAPATAIRQLGIAPFKALWMTEMGFVAKAAAQDFAALLSWANTNHVAAGSARWFWYGEGLSALTAPDGSLTATGQGLAGLAVGS